MGLFSPLCVSLCLALSALPDDAALRESAAQFDQQLRTQIMPYWFDRAQDRQHGGYALEAGSKQLVGPTRMVWGFSHAHRQGLSAPERDYLQAARQGYEFLQRHFLDPEHGGYYWMTDDVGEATNRHKMVYGQAFVESLRINRTHFYPPDPAECVFHCRPDWSRVTDKSSEGLSYGHNVEFAWLMLRAQQALDQSLAWDHFYAHLDHALAKKNHWKANYHDVRGIVTFVDTLKKLRK